MRSHKGADRSFHRYTQGRLSQPGEVPDEIVFGLFHGAVAGGGEERSGEMCMVWERILGPAPCPRLCVYGDSFSALGTMKDLIEALAKRDQESREDLSPGEFCRMLLDLGFSDRTNGISAVAA